MVAAMTDLPNLLTRVRACRARRASTYLPDDGELSQGGSDNR